MQGKVRGRKREKTKGGDKTTEEGEQGGGRFEREGRTEERERKKEKEEGKLGWGSRRNKAER